MTNFVKAGVIATLTRRSVVSIRTDARRFGWEGRKRRPSKATFWKLSDAEVSYGRQFSEEKILAAIEAHTRHAAITA